MRISRAALAIAFLPVAAHAQGSVWVVDAQSGPGSDFAKIQQAVDAAASGDMILVRAGSYESFTVDGKGIAVHSDAGADVVVGEATGGPALIRNLGVGQIALLRGLRMSTKQMSAGAIGPSTSVFNVQGRAWLEDCQMTKGHPSLYAYACASVVVARCKMDGGPSYVALISTLVSGSPGAMLSGSSARFYGCELTGPAGGGAFPPITYGGSPGVPAASISGGSLYAARTSFQGGKGGNGAFMPFPFTGCDGPGAGGPGIWLESNDPAVQLVASQAMGGVGGTNPCGATAPPGPPIDVDSGTVLVMPGEGAALETNSPVREGQVLTATVSAPPLSLAFLAVSAAPADFFMPGLSGYLQLDFPWVLAAAGVVPPSGQFSASATIQELGPGIEGIVVYAQAASCASGLCSLGSPSAVLLLDASF